MATCIIFVYVCIVTKTPAGDRGLLDYGDCSLPGPLYLTTMTSQVHVPVPCTSIGHTCASYMFDDMDSIFAGSTEPFVFIGISNRNKLYKHAFKDTS